jgi:hypothetical protein
MHTRRSQQLGQEHVQTRSGITRKVWRTRGHPSCQLPAKELHRKRIPLEHVTTDTNPPSRLSNDAKAIWREYLALRPEGFWTQPKLLLLETLADAEAARRTALAELTAYAENTWLWVGALLGLGRPTIVER